MLSFGYPVTRASAPCILGALSCGTVGAPHRPLKSRPYVRPAPAKVMGAFYAFQPASGLVGDAVSASPPLTVSRHFEACRGAMGPGSPYARGAGHSASFCPSDAAETGSGRARNGRESDRLSRRDARRTEGRARRGGTRLSPVRNGIRSSEERDSGAL